MIPDIKEFYCIHDTYKPYFYMLPKSLFVYNKYRELDLTGKVTYAVLTDRVQLSRKNNWIDKYGRIYLCFKQQELADLLNTNRSTIARSLKKLQEFGLIVVEDQGRGHTSRIYVKKIVEPREESEINYAEDELGKAELEAERLERLENPLKSCSLENMPCANSNISVNTRVEPCSVENTPCAPENTPCAPGDTPCSPEVTRVRMNNQYLLSKTKKRDTYHEEDDDKSDPPLGDDVKNVIELYRENNSHAHQCGILPIEKDIIIDHCNKFTSEWVSAAIKQAVIYGHPHLQYISKILFGWKENGFMVKPVKKQVDISPVKVNAKKAQNKTAQETYDGAKEILKSMGVMQ